MQGSKSAMLLRIFFGESDRYGHQALHEAIVMKAREAHLAGATVLRGPMGFGQSSRCTPPRSSGCRSTCRWWWRSSTPRTRSVRFLPTLDALMAAGPTSGLVTLEKVEVLQYGPGGQQHVSLG